jgi:hypothetical protein
MMSLATLPCQRIEYLHIPFLTEGREIYVPMKNEIIIVDGKYKDAWIPCDQNDHIKLNKMPHMEFAKLEAPPKHKWRAYVDGYLGLTTGCTSGIYNMDKAYVCIVREEDVNENDEVNGDMEQKEENKDVNNE